ncbi:MAG: CopG family ribbon-helix-helix protein [Endozoicomonas sp.]|uniref:CopG family ribbon-helix-helix protein n=1 Tax=Endozoicomonas sp. TaxID=1892382 RepID=UPI003D9AFD0A
MSKTLKPVRFDEETLEKLEELAALEDRDTSYLIRSAVNDLIDAHEWQLEHSKETLKKINTGEMKTFSHDAVKKKFMAGSKKS